MKDFMKPFIEEPNFIRQSKNYRATQVTRTWVNSQKDIMKVILDEIKKNPDILAKLQTEEDARRLVNDYLAKPPLKHHHRTPQTRHPGGY